MHLDVKSMIWMRCETDRLAIQCKSMMTETKVHCENPYEQPGTVLGIQIGLLTCPSLLSIGWLSDLCFAQLARQMVNWSKP